MDGGAWQAAVQGVAKSRTRLSHQHFHHDRGKGAVLQLRASSCPPGAFTSRPALSRPQVEKAKTTPGLGFGKRHASAAAVLEADLRAGPGETRLNTAGCEPGCYQNAAPSRTAPCPTWAGAQDSRKPRRRFESGHLSEECSRDSGEEPRGSRCCRRFSRRPTPGGDLATAAGRAPGLAGKWQTQGLPPTGMLCCTLSRASHFKDSFRLTCQAVGL